MARVEYTGYQDGDVRDAAVVNAAWTAFQTQSTAIGAENIRDEGLDDRVLASGTVTADDDEAYYGATNGTWVQLSNTAYATLVLGAKTLTITNSGSGWTLTAATTQIRVRASVSFRFVYADNANPAENPYVAFRLQYVTNLGTTSPEDDTEIRYVRTRAVGSTVAAFPAATPVYSTHYYGCYTMTYLIAAGAATSLTSVSLQSKITTAGFYEVEEARIQAIRFVKAG